MRFTLDLSMGLDLSCTFSLLSFDFIGDFNCQRGVSSRAGDRRLTKGLSSSSKGKFLSIFEEKRNFLKR